MSSLCNLDEEWEQFITSNINKNDTYLPCGYNKVADIVKTTEIDTTTIVTKHSESEVINSSEINKHETAVSTIPKCEDLYISTKTKVLFLNHEIDIHRIFWEIPIIEYWRAEEGVIKKQMKIVSKTPEEYEEYRAKLVGAYYYTENVIKQINNPGARRIKFKEYWTK